MIRSIKKPILFFSSKEDKNLNCIRSDNSWSYELNDSHIKGSFKDQRGNYAIFYTCKVCDTKQQRSFTKNSYHNGVVIIRCEGCQNLHLIADNLGFFEDQKVNIEDLLKRSNQTVHKIQPEGELLERFNKQIRDRTNQNDTKKTE